MCMGSGKYTTLVHMGNSTPFFWATHKRFQEKDMMSMYVSIYYVSKNTIPDAQCITYFPTFG